MLDFDLNYFLILLLAQIRDESTNTLSKILLEKVEKVYNSVKIQMPSENVFVEKLYDQN